MLDSLLDGTSTEFPLNTALILDGKSYTYADLRRLTRSLSAALPPVGSRCGLSVKPAVIEFWSVLFGVQ